MKSKFATYDLCAVLHDLNKLKGMRVSNVYDINSKTYLLKMQKPNEKAFILFESGIRIHLTTYDWPKAIIPSGFSMKFRKHINTKRLTAVSQVGVDRIIDMQFGDAERSCHVIVELYDRGNVVLTDHDYMILNILRQRTDKEQDVRFSVRERYPLEQARQPTDFVPSQESVLAFLQSAKAGEPLKKSLIRHIPFGALLLDHVFTKLGIPLAAQIGTHIPPTEAGAELICRALTEAKQVSDEIINSSHGGFIAYEEVARENGASDDVESVPAPIQAFKEYYPYDFAQFRSPQTKLHILEFDTFSAAVDKYYSSIESQKAEQRVVSTEKETDKKLLNIKRDHEKRLNALAEVSEVQERRGEYVLYNKELVNQALTLMRTALANLKCTNKDLALKHRGPKVQPKNEQLGKWLEELAGLGEQPAAKAIQKLKLESNKFTMRLSNPYEESEPPLNVELDIGLNADQNARRLFVDKRTAEAKREKTAAATKKALKSALRSAKQQASNKISQAKMRQTNLIRARKTLWFEKFLWFISTDGFLVLAGRDAQQNELLVKRYMRPGDIYVHAEIQGASSVVIRCRSVDEQPPPRTLNEAGAFAVCFSTAWEANVSITAWWVKSDQVSRTAPTGEYLVAGSFMIRGKRNFLPSCPLQLGFGLMFKLDDESVQRHRLLSNREEEGSQSMERGEEADEEGEEGSLKSCEDEADQEEGEEKTEQYREDEAAEHEQSEGDEAGQSEGDEAVQSEGDEAVHPEGDEADEEEEFPDVQVRLDGVQAVQSPTEVLDGKEEEKVEKATEEVDENELEEANSNEDAAFIDTLTAQPLAEDQLLFAMPVCGPYATMQKFKFKVKITPGTGKRGKAVKMALELFNRNKSLSLVEKALLKSLVGDDRLLQQLPGKVRVTAPNMMASGTK